MDAFFIPSTQNFLQTIELYLYHEAGFIFNNFTNVYAVTGRSRSDFK